MRELDVSVSSDRQSETIQLEARLRLPESDDTVRGVVLCHPHPGGGGEMGVGLLSVLSGSLCASGFAVLRFNFGGVGGSGGVFTDGVEEPLDVASAFDYLLSIPEVDIGPVSVVGWSFGSWMALTAVARGLPAGALVAIAPPIIAYDWRGTADDLAASGVRRYYIAGDSDPFCPLADLRDFTREVSTSDEDNVTVLPGADHFMFGREQEVADLVKGLLL